MFGGYASFWVFTLLDIDPFLSLSRHDPLPGRDRVRPVQALFSRMVKLDEEVKIKNTLLVGFGLVSDFAEHRAPPLDRR